MLVKVCCSILLSYCFFVFTGCAQNKKESVKHEFTNLLAKETSPYLLQHAHNPVNWMPWGEESLEKAQKEDKLLVISIGYSSCHWCHVMEKETFEDVEAAKFMNANFINIKVDREERPDVDQVYMTALQLISGSGGWPLNVVALPDGKPVYAGTYHSKEQWIKVLGKIEELYRKDPEKVRENGELLSQGVRDVNLVEAPIESNLLTKEFLHNSVANWQEYWDLQKGGAKQTQKFMMPSTLDFLLDYAVLKDDALSKAYLKTTLDAMANGGIYDHIGGGFYRYSTDPNWKIPHFEKMLYDNAQLLGVYSKAYKVFKDPLYKDVVYGISSFLSKEMKGDNGGYMAAIDADSEGGEGVYYIWTVKELEEILGSEYKDFASYFNIEEDAVWEHNSYVLRKTKAFNAKELAWREKLLKPRSKRNAPGLDDKIIVSWNALLINGFIEANKAFNDDQFLEKAKEIVSFIDKKGYKGSELIHSYKKGGKHIAGFSEDYAFLANALINMYSVTGNVSYLNKAVANMDTAKELFWDPKNNMYTYNGNSKLISKIIKTNDGVIPSPNAVLAQNLYLLGHINYDKDKMAAAKTMLAFMGSNMESNLNGHAKWGSLLLHTTYPFYEMAVVGEKSIDLMKDLHQLHLPNTLIVGTKTESNLPLFKDRFMDEDTFIYLCKETTCKLPVETVEEVVKQWENF